MWGSMTYRIVPTQSAEIDLSYYRVHERRIILDAIKSQLSHDPDVESKRRKRLRENPKASWELRVGNHREFYRIEANDVVVIGAIGHKEHNDLLVRGKKIHL